ncbi:MAG: hypothetical protein ACRD6U_08390 [Nitrososphaeraceae archaeon]
MSDSDPTVIDFEKVKADFAARCEQLNLLLEDWIDDIRSMDIVTATGKDLRVKIDPTNSDLLNGLPAEVQIKARTTIQLDGDLTVLLPTKQGTDSTIQIDNDILQIHKENVDFALKNLTNNMKIITDGIVRALSLAKEYGLPGISNKLT